MENNRKYRVYIQINGKSEIIRIEGEYSLPNNLTGWIKIDEGPEPEDRLVLAQNNYLPKPLMDIERGTGKYNYKYINGQIVEA